MFGIGGGEFIFIIFIALMLFGADKIPDIARTLGKGMAQLKNATDDIKNEIHKGAEANGLDQTLREIHGNFADMTNNINSEITQAKTKLLADPPATVAPTNENATPSFGISDEPIDGVAGPIKRQE